MKPKTPNDLSPGSSQSPSLEILQRNTPRTSSPKRQQSSRSFPSSKPEPTCTKNFRPQVPFQVRIIQSNLRGEFYYVTFLAKNATARWLPAASV